ncbi:diadenylate cyclase [Sinomicrobium weinanense]|uniref:Diadenylate cyclase n=1 Tax=Sinomicrobium weinanense TaxID=2842200 RepID=A0A926JUU3_9FLAO|nr:diadenylate cyclase [Sinomicrobium weinanense]MBC9797601.1 diadenylate cyclase [Sinomicrobium weinanense]MBU3123423.1 diadenylate cyclase [Sinomicrobium weinanense]
MKIFDFLNFTIIDIIDIVLLAFLLYYVYKLVKGTVAVNIFIGFGIIYLIWRVTEVLQMHMISSIFGSFMSVGFFALIVLFQQEIRKFLLTIGSTNLANRKNLKKYFRFFKNDGFDIQTNVDALVAACEKLGSTKTGALLVIQRNTPLDFVKNTGDSMSIKITIPIIESIFYKNSPLHDGAVVIEGNYIVATRVVLPVSNERSIPLRFGLRHRAAIGITDKTDALVLVVSEETGQISYIKDGRFSLFSDTAELIAHIKEDLS